MLQVLLPTKLDHSIRLGLIGALPVGGRTDVVSCPVVLKYNDPTIIGEESDFEGAIEYSECEEDILILIEDGDGFERRMQGVADILRRANVMPHKIVCTKKITLVWRGRCINEQIVIS